MRLFIMRHARYDYSLNDYQKLKAGPMPSAQGMRETETFAKKLSARTFAAVYTNGANRSKIAARIISKRNAKHPRVVMSREIDPMKVDYTGKDIIAHVKSAKTRSRTGDRWVNGELPSIEPLGDFMARVARFLLELAAHHRTNDAILIVAHWETYAAIEAILRRTPIAKAMQSHDTFRYNTLYAFTL